SKEDPCGAPTENKGKQVSQRHLEHPKANKIELGGRPGIACSVECAHHHHGYTIENIAGAHDTQGHRCDMFYFLIIGKECGKEIACYQTKYGDKSHINHYVPHGFEHRVFGAIKLFCSQVLANQCCGSIAHSPCRQ